MIRVVVRYADDADGVLLGDFPPSEIRPLLELLADTVIFMADGTEVKPSVTQFVAAGGRGAPRYVFEVITE